MTLRIEEMKAYMASFIVEGQGRSFSIKQRQLETMLAQGIEKLQQLRTTVDLSVFPVLSHRQFCCVAGGDPLPSSAFDTAYGGPSLKTRW